MTSLFGIRNNSTCAKIKLEIKFNSEEGRVVCMLDSFWLHPKHRKLIDLANIGCIVDGWVGAAEVQVGDWEILCNEYLLGEWPPEWQDDSIMPSAVVVNRVPPGVTTLGHETRVYEASPIQQYCIPQCWCTAYGHAVASDEDQAPLADATVTVGALLWCDSRWEDDTTTDDDGYFELAAPCGDEVIYPPNGVAVVSKSGYLDGTVPDLYLDLFDCGAEVDVGTISVRMAASVSGVVRS